MLNDLSSLNESELSVYEFIKQNPGTTDISLLKLFDKDKASNLKKAVRRINSKLGNDTVICIYTGYRYGGLSYIYYLYESEEYQKLMRIGKAFKNY